MTENRRDHASQLVLSTQQVAMLRAAAESAYPRECCGLLIGNGADRILVTEIHASANVAEEPTHRFEIDPQLQFDLLRAVRGTGERVVGHFHSHPNGAATLSRHDLEMAHDPEAVWLLIPVAASGRAETPVAFICSRPDTPRAVEVRVV
jgi:proteasome lid subunit RPN8/RPN11